MKPTTQEPLLATVQEACDTLKISKRQMYNLFKEGLITRIKIGGSTRIPWPELKRIAKEGATW